MRRREFIKGIVGSAAAWPLAARAQQAAKVWRIGFLAGAPREANSRNYASFVEGMRELGYGENKDFVIEWRSASEQYERFPELAGELIRLKVDVIVTAAGAAIRTLQNATTTIPIVWVYSTDPNFASVLKNVQVAGERAGLSIMPVAAGNVEDAFAAFDKQGMQGVI